MVELVYDVFDVLHESTLDTLARSHHARRHVREALHAARHVIDALAVLVDDLDHAAAARGQDTEESETLDFQTIPLA